MLPFFPTLKLRLTFHIRQCLQYNDQRGTSDVSLRDDADIVAQRFTITAVDARYFNIAGHDLADSTSGSSITSLGTSLTSYQA